VSRPRQARAIATRAAIVQATIRALADGGLSATSTAAVARAAGVSQGALFGHFSTKAALLTAATEAILDELFVAFAEALPGAAGAGDLLDQGLAALWTVYQDPRLAGLFELFLAARHDPDLQAGLSPLLVAHADRELAMARALFPDAAHRDDFDAVVIGLLSTLQGAAVAAGVLPGHAGHLELRFITELVRRELGSPSLPQGPHAETTP
jgi:AcrR family transcriptional regulator